MTKEDTINELNYIKESFAKCELSYEALDMAIKALEEPKWIPCGSRLPYERSTKIVTLKSGDVECGYYSDGNWWVLDADGEMETGIEAVLAYMPLPEPWRGDAE